MTHPSTAQPVPVMGLNFKFAALEDVLRRGELTAAAPYSLWDAPTSNAGERCRESQPHSYSPDWQPPTGAARRPTKQEMRVAERIPGLLTQVILMTVKTLSPRQLITPYTDRHTVS